MTFEKATIDANREGSLSPPDGDKLQQSTTGPAVLSDLIQAIHTSNLKFELAVTGGGTSVIGALLSVAGASNSILNAVVPYHANALRAYLGLTPPQSCSEETARFMANRAFLNGLALTDDQRNTIGVGATAALQTNRQRKGSDRIHVAIQTNSKTESFELRLQPSDSREQQELASAQFILQAIASQLGLVELEKTQQAIAPLTWQSLLRGEARASDNSTHPVIFPGAFNPPHEGHRQMANIAQRHLGQPVTFEISILNVDKPPLDFIDMQTRQDRLNDQQLVFTRAPTFLEKSNLFPGCTFVVGIDTLVRIDNARYYNDSEQTKHAAIQHFTDAGHHFLVFGRRLQDGPFEDLSSSRISKPLAALSQQIPEQTFRADVSSSELRR